jgi:hypothetical protein
MFGRWLLALVLVGGIIACGRAASPATTDMTPTPAAAINVSGVLDRGPATTCPTGEPCDPLIATVYVVFSQAGKPDVRASVDPSGAFAVHLDPGAYTIAAAPPLLNRKLTPSSVRVPAQGAVTLHLTIS